MNSGEGWKSGNKYFLHMSLFKVREKCDPNANFVFSGSASLESGAVLEVRMKIGADTS